ncbi:SAM-dependent methyltransferase [filamentous cyanobacterium CCP5]|nr:SAM-dependent methyltransferase [filamentous cyanobacterium CCP5]
MSHPLSRLMALLVAACLAVASFACSSPVLESGPIYDRVAPSSDGIGKVYMGREISQVMGHQGAYWLERPSRSQQERPDLAIAALDLAPDATVADIGAGTGYMSFRLARSVPEGKVLAVDIQPEMVDFLEAEKAERDLENVRPVLGDAQDPHLDSETIDLALMVDAYHEFAYPREMMQALVAALKPGGQVVLAEYRAENPLILIKPHHKMSQAQVKAEMAAVGLEWLKTDESLPQQHLMFFQKPVSAPAESSPPPLLD